MSWISLQKDASPSNGKIVKLVEKQKVFHLKDSKNSSSRKKKKGSRSRLPKDDFEEPDKEWKQEKKTNPIPHRKELEIGKLKELVSVNRKYALDYDAEHIEDSQDFEDILNERMSRQKFAYIYKKLFNLYKAPVKVHKNFERQVDIRTLLSLTLCVRVSLNGFYSQHRIVCKQEDVVSQVVQRVIAKLPDNICNERDTLKLFIPATGVYMHEKRDLYSYYLEDNQEVVLRKRVKERGKESVTVALSLNDHKVYQKVTFYPQTTVFGVIQSIKKKGYCEWNKPYYHISILDRQYPLDRGTTLYALGLKHGDHLELFYSEIGYPIESNMGSYDDPIQVHVLCKNTGLESDISIGLDQPVGQLIKEAFIAIGPSDSYWNLYGLFASSSVVDWIDDHIYIHELNLENMTLHLMEKPDGSMRQKPNLKRPDVKSPNKSKRGLKSPKPLGSTKLSKCEESSNLKSPVKKRKSSKSSLKTQEPSTSSDSESNCKNSKKKLKLYDVAIEINVPNTRKIAKKVRLTRKETGHKIKSLLQEFLPLGEDIHEYRYILPFVGDVEMPDNCMIVPFLKAYMGDRELTLRDRIQLVKNNIY